EPADPGTLHTFRLEGLQASTAYAVAVRAEDAAGNISDLGDPLVLTTLAPPSGDPGDGGGSDDGNGDEDGDGDGDGSGDDDGDGNDDGDGDGDDDGDNGGDDDIPPVDLPPAPIHDLAVVDRGPSWVDLAWTPSGEDGTDGRASAYSIRYLRGEPILNEQDWERAHELERPVMMSDEPVHVETFRLEGINPQSSYGVAV